MNRTKQLFSAVFILITGQAYSQSSYPAKGFILNGTVNEKLNAATAVVSYKSGTTAFLDSIPVTNGQFNFQGESQGPVFVKITILYKPAGKSQKTDNISFYVDGTAVQLRSPDSIKHAVVIGSPIHDEYLEYRKLIALQFSRTALLNSRWTKADKEKRDHPFLKDSIDAARKALDEQKKTELMEYIAKHPDTYFSLLALKELAGSRIDVSTVEPVFLRLSEKVRSTPAGREFTGRIEKNRLTSVGSLAPDFTLNDPDGKPVTLSTFRGQYVLLIFWASWCGPCRKETPNVVRMYHQYKDKNFHILSVSLDRPEGRQAWLEAIRKDGMMWTQVSDLKSWENAAAKIFGVVAIPQNYLLDPTGKIIATNLRGEALDKKLKELF